MDARAAQQRAHHQDQHRLPASPPGSTGHDPLPFERPRSRVQSVRGARRRRPDGDRPVRRDGRRHRTGVLHELQTVAAGPIAASFADADRNPPVYDPATFSVTLPESFKKSYRALVDGEWYRLEPALRSRRLRRRHRACAGRPPKLVLGANPALFMYSGGPNFASSCTATARPLQQRMAETMIEKKLGLDDGADRAGRRQRRRRRTDQGDPAGRRQLAPRGREAVHHLRRIRSGRQHRPPGTRPSRRSRHREPARHQGFEPVHRAEVPFRPGDRRAGRAQRSVRHRAGAQRWG